MYRTWRRKWRAGKEEEARGGEGGGREGAQNERHQQQRGCETFDFNKFKLSLRLKVVFEISTFYTRISLQNGSAGFLLITSASQCLSVRKK